MSHLNTHQGPPRKSPAYKFLMRHPDYKEALDDEYKRRFGPNSQSKVADRASGATSSPGPLTSTTGTDNSSHISNAPEADAEAEADANANADADAKADADKGADADADADSGESGEEEENPRYALSHRVQVAKDVFAQLSAEEKAELKADLEQDFQKKKELYEKAARGENLYDPALLTQYVVKSILILCSNAYMNTDAGITLLSSLSPLPMGSQQCARVSFLSI